MSDFTRGEKARIAVLVFVIALQLALFGGAIYVAIHFARKFW